MNIKSLIKISIITLCASILFTSCGAIDLEFIKGEFTPTNDCGEKIRASDFTVYDALDNKSSFSDFKGKPAVVLLYGERYNGVTRDYMMCYDSAFRKYGDKVNFMIVHLSGLRNESKENAETLVSGLSFPAYYDIDNSAQYAYSVSAYPRTIIVDAEGYIYHDQTGSVDSKFLDKHIERVINGEPYVTEAPKRCGCRFK